MKGIFVFLVVFGFMFSCKKNEKLNIQEIQNDENWVPVFNDDCTKDWTAHWTLDGLAASINHTDRGMHFKAGPEYYNDAHHAVLWTKASFYGDVKIEFDYTKTDNETRFVNILYIQATGDGEGVFERDISKWEALRQVPAMRMYFENMDLFHISFAAFGNRDNGFHYIRARRYPKQDDRHFSVTQIEPSYDRQGFFETGKTYHITAIKTKTLLYFKMKSMGHEEHFEWDISEIAPISEGRIGLRHMFTRSAIYKNFKIYTKQVK